MTSTITTRPLVISTRSTRDPDPIHHMGRQDDAGKWHTLCNGGAAVLIEGPIGGRGCIRCDAARIRETSAGPQPPRATYAADPLTGQALPTEPPTEEEAAAEQAALDHPVGNQSQPNLKGHDLNRSVLRTHGDGRPRKSRECAEKFGISGEFDPHCCRFPKACSPYPYDEAFDAGNVAEEDLEPRREAPEPRPAADLALTRSMSVEMLEKDLPSLKVGLEAGITAAVTVLREERGQVVAAEDTFDLIRRLVHAQDVLTRVAAAYTDAAKTAGQIIAEELSAAVGEQDGVPMGRLVVPAGEFEYVIKPVFSTAPDTWDWPSLVGVLADLAEEGQPAPTTDPDNDGLEVHERALKDYAREVAADALTRFLGLLSSPKLKATAVDALRRKVSAAGDDARAAVLGQSRVKGGQTYRETVSVDVEEAKARRR